MNISDLNDLLEESFETGDYSKLKAIIKKYEHKNIYLYEVKMLWIIKSYRI